MYLMPKAIFLSLECIHVMKRIYVGIWALDNIGSHGRDQIPKAAAKPSNIVLLGLVTERYPSSRRFRDEDGNAKYEGNFM